jgi:hypothetical protein
MNDTEHIGLWNLQEFGFILVANSSPEVDRLMDAYYQAKADYVADEPRVRKLVRPWLGDPRHHRLERERNYARAQVVKYLLDHRELIIINGR